MSSNVSNYSGLSGQVQHRPTPLIFSFILKGATIWVGFQFQKKFQFCSNSFFTRVSRLGHFTICRPWHRTKAPFVGVLGRTPFWVFRWPPSQSSNKFTQKVDFLLMCVPTSTLGLCYPTLGCHVQRKAQAITPKQAGGWRWYSTPNYSVVVRGKINQFRLGHNQKVRQEESLWMKLKYFQWGVWCTLISDI